MDLELLLFRYFSSQNIILTVNDVDDTGPIIKDSNLYFFESITEKEVAIFEANEKVSWQIKGGKDSDLFVLNSKSGKLRFKNPPDFENPLDIDKNNQYELEIRATDEFNNFSDKKFTIKVADANIIPNNENIIRINLSLFLPIFAFY